MKYDVTIFDFDRSEDTMKDGHHYDVEAFSATQAVLKLIRELSDYEEGTVGLRNYMQITEIESGDDNLNVTAYRNDNEWNVHIYIDAIDEAFTIPA